jgi:hypothetical protein
VQLNIKVAGPVQHSFFAKGLDCIKPLFLQKDPEKKGNYNELLLLLDPDFDEDNEPSAARRCRCSATRLGKEPAPW